MYTINQALLLVIVDIPLPQCHRVTIPIHQHIRHVDTARYLVEEAYQAFKRVLANRKNDKRVEIDGYSDFLFLNRKNYPKVASDYNGMMKGLVKKYNKYNEDKLPHITPHSLRHTFCTNYANAGMNPKALQYIMGHANIAMTLNYYAHATFDSAMAEMKRLNKEKQQERLVA